METLVDQNVGCMKDMKHVKAVGHRVLHGGEKFTKSVIVDN